MQEVWRSLDLHSGPAMRRDTLHGGPNIAECWHSMIKQTSVVTVKRCPAFFRIPHKVSKQYFIGAPSLI